MQKPAVWQQQRLNLGRCEAQSLATRLGLPANCAPLAVASLHSPYVAQQRTSIPLLRQLLAAKGYAKPLPPREFQFCELLGLVREHPAYKP